MYVRVYVCMRMHLSLSNLTLVRLCCMYVCVCVCMHVCACVCMYEDAAVVEQLDFGSPVLYVCMYVRVSVHICV